MQGRDKGRGGPERDVPDTSRRGLLKGVSLLPLAAASGALALDAGPAPAQEAQPAYQPVFFTADEWAFLTAACDRLIPSDEVGPGAVELGTVEFIDRHMQTPYASGAIWYMAGPFQDSDDPNFGYQGRLTVKEILRAGIGDTDAWCRANRDGKTFAELSHEEQEAILTELQERKIELPNVPVRYFWQHLLAETRYGYFSDPIHGGNKGMGSWKMIGYPGMRADFTDWVGVRDKPYPFGPVDLMGRRG